MAEFIRARSAEHKQERMHEIMAAADGLFQSLPYSDVTLSLIGKELGWSRANLYKYISTKEEIFLLLHSEKTRAFFAELRATFTQLPLETSAFARTWAEITERHDGFLRYQDILVSVIESNVSLEALTEFKRDFFTMVAPISELIATQCACNTEQGYKIYFTLIYQAVGLRGHYKCNELAAEAMARAGVPHATGTFVDTYAEFVEMCLQNM